MKLKNAQTLEIDQLDEVVGGGAPEGYGDGYTGWANSSRFLNDLFDGSVCNRYGDWRAVHHKDEIKNAWKKLGVQVYWGKRYVIKEGENERSVTPKEAFQYAMKKVGKYLPEYSWCW